MAYLACSALERDQINWSKTHHKSSKFQNVDDEWYMIDSTFLRNVKSIIDQLVKYSGNPSHHKSLTRPHFM
jgi:uncharacterized protein YchJ